MLPQVVFLVFIPSQACFGVENKDGIIVYEKNSGKLIKTSENFYK